MKSRDPQKATDERDLFDVPDVLGPLDGLYLLGRRAFLSVIRQLWSPERA